MNMREISRRQFLEYTALGAGALSLGSPVGKRNEIPGQGCPPGTICNEVTYIPHLKIPDGSNTVGILDSKDIWVVGESGLTEPMISPPLFEGRGYHIVAQIFNEGFAPAFNVIVNFYEVRVINYVFLLDIGKEPLDPIFSRDWARWIGTEIISVPPKSPPIKVVCQNPWTPMRPASIPQVPHFFSWFIVVECFDPLVDPLPGDFKVLYKRQDRKTERHRAGREFGVLPRNPRINITNRR